MNYEDQLREALQNRADQLDDRRPALGSRAIAAETVDSGDVRWWQQRRWHYGALMAAAAAATMILVVFGVGNRSVDRVETVPELAAQPSAVEETATQSIPAAAPSTPVQNPFAVGLGPATIVGPDGATLFVLGEDPPPAIARDVVALIEFELLSMPALGERPFDRQAAIADAGLVVQIALDLPAQQRAIDAIEAVPTELDAVAITVDSRTGDIVSAASRSGTSLGLAQPAGSARIVTYAAALELGLDQQSMIDGSGPCVIETDVGPVSVDNFGDSPGSIILLSQQALRASRCAEARLEALAGADAIARLMQSMTGTDLDGMVVDAPELTAIEHVAAVAAASNNGERPAIGWVSQIRSADGVVVFDRPAATPVISRSSASALTEIMQANVERGTGTRAAIDGTDVGGFTGSDEQFRAAWFVGSANGLSTAVWLARPDGEPMIDVDGRNVTGGSFPADLWARIHRGFAEVEPLVGDAPREQPVAVPVCPRGFPVEVDSDADGIVDTCFRQPADTPFERPSPAVEVNQDSCPSSHPVATDIDGDGTNETCMANGFTNTAPAADYATSIEVRMQTGQPALDRYESTVLRRDDVRPGSVIFVGTALAGDEQVELFRWQVGGGRILRQACLGAEFEHRAHANCAPTIDGGPQTGGGSPVSEGDELIDPNWFYSLSDAPVGATWFVIDTTEGARVIANIVGDVSMAIWPEEAGGPSRISVLSDDHTELWSFGLD